MKLSKYTYLFKSSLNVYFLYNAETNSFAKLDQSIFQLLENIREGQANISDIDSSLLLTLKKAKVIVESDNNYIYEKKLRYYAQNFDSTSLDLAIAPTTFCNFDCPYCFEENRKPIFMTEKTENDIIGFIKKYKHVNKTNIEWYGGEPLAGFKAIKNILNKISLDPEIVLGKHKITTNGYLLDEKKSRFFMQYPLDVLQITIDGNQKIHDLRRKLKNGDGTYDTICRNIDVFFKYNKNTCVTIRVNIDADNADDFFYLQNILRERWKNEKLHIYFAFVRDYTENCGKHCNILDKKQQLKFYVDLFSKHKSAINLFPDLQMKVCGATVLNYFVVGPQGELYKCWNDIGTEEKIIGFVDKEIIPNKNVLCQYMVGPTMYDDSQCMECGLFPICDGGCQWLRLKNINEGKNNDLCTNKKEYLNTFLELHYMMKKDNSSI